MDTREDGVHTPQVSEFVACLVEIMTRNPENVQLSARQLADFPQWLNIAGDRCLAVRAHRMMREAVGGARFVRPAENGHRPPERNFEEAERMMREERERGEKARIQEEQARLRAERAKELEKQARENAERLMQLELREKREEEERARIREEERARLLEEQRKEQEKIARIQEEQRKEQEKRAREQEEERIRKAEEARRNEIPVITNKPHVNFMSFIGKGRTYLKFNKHELPAKLSNQLNDDAIKYPIGVTYDERSSNWFICDRNTSKMAIFNTKTENITICDQLKGCTAVMVYEEGRTVAVLCAHKNMHTIYAYSHWTPEPTIRPIISHTEEIYDMKYKLRGLAKSAGSNIISMETNTLRVFKERVGAKMFEMADTMNPCFLTTVRTTVAVSDVILNKVFIFSLDDRNWEAATFSKLKVIGSNVELSSFKLADQSGFKFVCGIQFDVMGNLMVADSKGHSMKVYNSEFNFVHRVSSDAPLPYVSSFFVNQQGECMLLDTKDPDRKLVRVKLTSSPSIVPWVRPEYWGPMKK